MITNRAASVRARLKQHADATSQDYNSILTRYALERLVYRLSVSGHAPNFLLKGALLFGLWFDTPLRPTRDIDLLGFGRSRVDGRDVPRDMRHPGRRRDRLSGGVGTGH